MYRIAICLALGALALTEACSVSQSDERTIGAEEAASVDSELPILRDSAVTAFVAKLGQSIASRTSRADLDWRFAVVNTDDVNAFSLPGGFIYVNRGLIEQSERLDELAGVMAHEIGHVVRRHSVKQLQKAAKRDVGVVLLCTLTRACHTLGGAIAVRIGADAMSARYSQRDETEADSRHAGVPDHPGTPAGVAATTYRHVRRDAAPAMKIDGAAGRSVSWARSAHIHTRRTEQCQS
jgi:predicted Zn-dependent protease